LKDHVVALAVSLFPVIGSQRNDLHWNQTEETDRPSFAAQLYQGSEKPYTSETQNFVHSPEGIMQYTLWENRVCGDGYTLVEKSIVAKCLERELEADAQAKAHETGVKVIRNIVFEKSRTLQDVFQNVPFVPREPELEDVLQRVNEATAGIPLAEMVKRLCALARHESTQVCML
jgi:hypothetical protein